MIILPVGLRGAVSTHATHTPRSAVVLFLSLRLSPPRVSLRPCLALSSVLLFLLLSRRLVILQFHVLPYGNIVIFPPPPPPLSHRCIFARHRALVSAHLDSRPARPRIRDHAGTSFGWMCPGDLGRIESSFWNVLVAITTNCNSDFAVPGNRIPIHFRSFVMHLRNVSLRRISRLTCEDHFIPGEKKE